MQIINIDSVENIHLYPFFYLKEYILFVKESEHKDVVFFSDKYENTIACKIWKNKFLNYIQPIYPPLDKEANRLTKEAERFFLENFIKLVRSLKKYDRISVGDNFSISHAVPRDSVYSKFGTYYINLQSQTEETLFGNIHTKHRNVIKNAEKNNVVIKYGEECIEEFYLLYRQTMQRSNMYCQSISYFKDFYTYLPKNTICGVAYSNNIPQGALFMPYTLLGAFYLYGASAEKIAVNGAINYLHWNTIKLLKQLGIKRYDFVGTRLSDVSGTKLEGIQQFKKRFGAELEEGFLWKADLNKNKCEFYDALLKLKIKLRGNEVPLDIIDQERKKTWH